MVIKISKKASTSEIQQGLRKLSGKTAKKYFGKLVRGFDGDAYQKEVRNEWS